MGEWGVVAMLELKEAQLTGKGLCVGVFGLTACLSPRKVLRMLGECVLQKLTKSLRCITYTTDKRLLINLKKLYHIEIRDHIYWMNAHTSNLVQFQSEQSKWTLI